MSLAGLGLSALEEQVYRFLLSSPDRDLSALGLDAVQIGLAVDRLISLGLATVDDSGVPVAVPPDAGLELLAQRKIAKIIADLQDVAKAREAFPSIIDDADQATPVMPPKAERILGASRVLERIHQEWLLDSASEVRSVRSGQRASTYRHGELSNANTLFNLRRGVRYSTLIHVSTLDHPRYVTHARDLHRAGDIHRVTSDPIQTMVVYDRTRAYVPLEADNPEAGALRIQDPGTIATLVDLFDSTFDRATDLELALVQEITALDKQVLGALVEHSTDEAAARRLNMSVRTFRRHVAGLMNRLNAGNRFQLAALAKEKGWL